MDKKIGEESDCDRRFLFFFLFLSFFIYPPCTHPQRIGNDSDTNVTLHNQIEGQLNERIVATALYYLDSENVTPSYLSFRMQADRAEELAEQTEQGMYGYYERLYGTALGSDKADACLQNYGDVETRPGRLLVFPNVL